MKGCMNGARLGEERAKCKEIGLSQGGGLS